VEATVTLLVVVVAAGLTLNPTVTSAAPAVTTGSLAVNFLTAASVDLAKPALTAAVTFLAVS
jgi:hypothetical protein